MFWSILRDSAARRAEHAIGRSVLESLERRRLLSLVTFQSSINVNDGGQPAAVATADMNGDGKTDLVTEDYAGAVTVLLGNGDGTFAVKQTIPESIDTSAFGVTIADFNNDGHPDVALITGTETITLLSGSSDGTLTPAGSVNGAMKLHSVIAADVTGDGNMDLVASDLYGGVEVFLGDGKGDFSAPIVTRPTNTGSTRVVAGHFVNGGPLDLALTNYTAGTVSILIGNGDGTFKVAGNYSGITAVTSIVTADFNNDGNADLAVGSLIGVTELLGNGNGTFKAPIGLGITSNVDYLATADLDGDGNADLIASAQNYGYGGQIVIALGYGNGSFQSPQTMSAGNYPQVAVVADLEGDGHPDLLVAEPDAYTVGAFINTTSNLPDIAISSGGAVTATGTPGNDTVLLSVLSGDLTVMINTVSRSFPVSGITSIRVSGDAGNDSIAIATGVPTVFVNGGGGADTIVASNKGADTLQGGAGSDSIVGGGKDAELLDGGNGADTLVAGKGADTLTGDGAADSLVGGKRADSLDGGNGNDTLRAGTGANTLRGNAGNDSLIGGPGADLLLGGPGNDTIVGDTGDGGGNSLIGGSGIDILEPGPRDSEPDGNG